VGGKILTGCRKRHLCFVALDRVAEIMFVSHAWPTRNNENEPKTARLITQIFLTSLQALFFVQVLLVSNHPSVHAAAPLTKVLVTTGSASEREGALYVAQDQGYFRNYGLDLTFVQVRNGPVGMSALSSGESLLHWGSVSAANLGAIAEGADLVFVAGLSID
jgi:ABC-type nitrate/sulfonate/bicarbonate transport system substrate-binding protein